jgi:hypothetical protein
MKEKDILSRAIAEQFSNQVLFLQRLIQAKSVNTFTPATSLPDAPNRTTGLLACRDHP